MGESVRKLNQDLELGLDVKIDPKCISNLIFSFIASNKETNDLVVYFIPCQEEYDEYDEISTNGYTGLYRLRFKIFDKELRMLVTEGEVAVGERWLYGRNNAEYGVLIKFNDWKEYEEITPYDGEELYKMAIQCVKIDDPRYIPRYHKHIK